METPLVSVCMTTYNHEAWLAQAIESVLAQRTSFGVELVVGEDCSTDRTAEICSRLAAGNTSPTSTATTGGAIR